MKILGVETHYKPGETVATDYYRTIQPFKCLHKLGYDTEIRRGIIPEEAVSKDPTSRRMAQEFERIGKEYDAVYFSYNHSPILFSYVMALHKIFGTRIIIDYDDNLLEQDYHNPISVIQEIENPKERMNVEVVLENVPEITVTNKVIEKSIRDYCKTRNIDKDITVIPNYIDLHLYNKPDEIKRDGITIGFFGSVSHQADLYLKPFHGALAYIKNKYPQVRFEIIGNFLPGYMDGLGKVEIIPGDPNFYKWIDIWKKYVCQWDIGLAPLRDNTFNKSRSQIKYFELAAAHVPMIASDIGHYESAHVLKAKTKDEWIRQMEGLIINEQFRREMGEISYRDVVQNYTIQNNIFRWEQFFFKGNMEKRKNAPKDPRLSLI